MEVVAFQKIQNLFQNFLFLKVRSKILNAIISQNANRLKNKIKFLNNNLKDLYNRSRF